MCVQKYEYENINMRNFDTYRELVHKLPKKGAQKVPGP